MNIDSVSATDGSIIMTDIGEIQVKFNNKIDSDTVEGNIYLEDADGNRVNTFIQTDGLIATLKFGCLAGEASYKLVITNGVKSVNGKSATAKEYNYTTGESDENIKLKPVYTNAGDTSFDNTELKIGFNKAVSGTRLSLVDLTTNKNVEFTIEMLDSTTLKLKMNEYLEAGHKFKVTCGQDLEQSLEFETKPYIVRQDKFSCSVVGDSITIKGTLKTDTSIANGVAQMVNIIMCLYDANGNMIQIVPKKYKIASALTVDTSYNFVSNGKSEWTKCKIFVWHEMGDGKMIQTDKAVELLKQ